MRRAFPTSMACHCNDCRLATGTTPLQCLACPDYIVTVSALPRDEFEWESCVVTSRIIDPDTAVTAADADRPPYLPALQVLRPDEPGSRGTWLRFFHSFECSGRLSRAFCGRCGSHVSFHYQIIPDWFGGPDVVHLPEAGWRGVFDLMLGTVDRSLAEEAWMAPEREINWNSALPWVKSLSVQGSIAKKHPTMLLNEVVDEEELKTCL
jgi:hypothetical protein